MNLNPDESFMIKGRKEKNFGSVKGHIIKEDCKNLVLDNNEVNIWKTRVSKNIKNLNEYWNILSKEERDKAKSFYFIEDQNRYVVTKGVLRKLLSKYLSNISPEKILFAQTEYKKPFLVNNVHNIKFNVSHSKDVIIYAFANNIEIGVDVEHIDRCLEINDMIEYCCSEEEKIYLEYLVGGNKHSHFYKLWVIKEAIAKAIGVGILFDFKQININFSKSKFFRVTIGNRIPLYWTIKRFSVYNDYYAAFAAKGFIEKIVFLEFKI